MPRTSSSIHRFKPTYYDQSLPFYLKALFLMSVTTAAYAIRNNLSEQNLIYKTNVEPKYVVFPPMENNSLMFPEFETPGAERHLLAYTLPTTTEPRPVVITKHIPDQFIQINEQYSYELNHVFSGDYHRLRAAQALPKWLSLEYKRVGLYRLDNAEQISISGNTVFLAKTDEVLILNISDFSRPKLLGRHLLNTSFAKGLFVSNDTLFVTHEQGLIIFNTSDLSNPQVLSDYPIEYNKPSMLAVSGNIAYITNQYKGLLFLNISDLSNPQLLTTYPIGKPSVVAVSKTTLFVDNDVSELWVLNVTDPSNPQPMSFYETTSYRSFRFALSNNTLFLADGWNELLILNISDPLNLELIDAYSTDTLMPDDVLILDNTAFLISNTGLSVLNIQNLSNPQLMGAYEVEGNSMSGLAVSGNTLFLTTAQGLEVLDLHSASLRGLPVDVKSGQKWTIAVSAEAWNGSLITDTFQLTADISLPQLVKNTLTDQSIVPGESFSLTIESDQLFEKSTTSLLSFSLYQADQQSLPSWLSFETNPRLLRKYSIDTGYIEGLAVSGNTLYVAIEEALLILNVSDPSNPQILGTYDPEGTAKTVSIVDNIAFVSNLGRNLLIVNVSDPAEPKLISSYRAEKGSDIFELAVSNKTAYLATGDAGLLILDISDLSHPEPLHTYSPGKFATTLDVVVSGQIAYLANDIELSVLDVSNPFYPKLLSNYSTDGYIDGLEISDSTLFVMNEYILLILNVTNPFQPQLLSNYSAGNSPIVDIAVSNSKLFISNLLADLFILNVRDPSKPQLLSTYKTNSRWFFELAVSGNIVFMGNYVEGLYIVNANKEQFKIMANPAEADINNYPLTLTASDDVGASVSIQFKLRVEGTPKVKRNISWQYAELEKAFNFNIPMDTIIDPNNDHLDFNLSQSFANWLTFNSILMRLSGTPSSKDKGTSLLRLTAIDPLRTTAYVEFNISVIDPPKPIPDQPFSLIQGRPYKRTISLEGIFDENLQSFNYSLTFSEQDRANLYWLRHLFSGSNLTLFGLPNITGKMTLNIVAQTPLAYNASTPLALVINPNTPPQFKQRIPSRSAAVAEPFDFTLPRETFENPNGEPLFLNASLSDGNLLPDWLSFSQEADGWRFKGTPGGWDTNLFSSRVMTIQIIARNAAGQAIALFNLAVGGTSNFNLLLRFAAPILSILGLFQKRATFLNRLCYKRYQKPGQELEVGLAFNLPLSTPRDAVGSIEVKTRHVLSKGLSRFTDCHRFFKAPIHYLLLPFDPLPEGSSLPKWMEYIKSTNTLKGVLPTHIADRELFVFVKNRSGIVQEQFPLKIEGSILDQKERGSTELIPASLGREILDQFGSLNTEGYQALKSEWRVLGN